MKVMKERKLYQCNRCNWKWMGRKEKPPVTCPRCRSPYWSRERVNKTKKD
ncbi:MAG: hypothetical protein H8E13_00845 [Actinobacteria bacterium]|nr:hypothetical protein [Actinomycetota bacterium]